MSTENPDGGTDLPPSPFPDTVVYVWLTLLEAIIAATMVVFTIGILEGSSLVPDVLAEISVGMGTFVVVFVGLLAIRLRK